MTDRSSQIYGLRSPTVAFFFLCRSRIGSESESAQKGQNIIMSMTSQVFLMGFPSISEDPSCFEL